MNEYQLNHCIYIDCSLWENPMNTKYPKWKQGRGLIGEWIVPELRNCCREEMESIFANDIQR